MKLAARSMLLWSPAFVGGLVILSFVGGAVAAELGDLGLWPQPEYMQKRVIEEPCELKKFDANIRVVVESMDWKAAAEHQRLLVGETRPDTVSVHIDVADGAILHARFGNLFDPADHGPRETDAWVPVSLLCQISRVEAVTFIRGNEILQTW